MLTIYIPQDILGAPITVFHVYSSTLLLLYRFLAVSSQLTCSCPFSPRLQPHPESPNDSITWVSPCTFLDVDFFKTLLKHPTKHPGWSFPRFFLVERVGALTCDSLNVKLLTDGPSFDSWVA